VSQPTVTVELGGVAETLLWTLYQRAVEARRPDAVIDDPEAVALVPRIAYPFESRFGSRFGQWQALRARCFDEAVGRFLGTHPDGTVVASGEGLETQFWRVDNGRVRWLSVDLPEVIALREALLPRSDRVRAVACSALDPRWTAEVDAARGVLVTAQGLLMYLDRADAHRLIARCAKRFPGNRLVFDAVPRWLAVRSQRGQLKRSGGFQPPPWRWGVDADEEQRLAALPHMSGLRTLRPPRGRGALHGLVLPLADRVPALRRAMLTVYEVSSASS
jgi:O-methyltransferase involved in polyketide biosynthesis